MKAVLRACALLLLSLALVPATFADDAHSAQGKSKNKSGVVRSEKSAVPGLAALAADPMPRGSASLFPARPAASLSAFPQKDAKGKRPAKEPFELRPMPSTTGTLGVFTVDSGYLLPKRAYAVASYASKFSRMPGNITVLTVGTAVSVGVTDWFNFHVGWEPYRHIHTSVPSQLSLRTPATNPPFPSAAAPTIFRGLTVVPGSAPGYVEDFPFANRNAGGVGEVVVGFKLGPLSEWRGDYLSLSIRNDFYIPTKRTFGDLLDNSTQSGQFSWVGNVAASRTWWKDRIVSNWNFGYRLTRDPRSNRVRLFHQADQMKFATGTIFLPKHRVQIMTESVLTVFTGKATQNTTFGARDPIDSVWGVRFYPWSNFAVDLGYRRTGNLKDHGDKNGFIVKMGSVHWPEKPKPVNHSPVASCSAEKASVYAESGEMVGVRVMASDPDNDTLSYSWSATGGAVDGSGPAVKWNSAGTRTGAYAITASVSDGKGGAASCSVDIKVDPRPNRAPSMSCSADRSSVLTGERVRISASASDADNDPLSYSWRTNGGQVVGSGASVQLDTSGLAAGRYTVTGRVEDGRGGANDCSTSVEVRVPPPPPQAMKLSECFFRAASARVDNVCKRVMDDVALRLQNDPKARVAIIGYADPKERKPEKLAKDRADAAKKYLVSKGIADARMDTRAAGGQKGADKQNRRVDVIWVPEGATY
ncbi:MAG: OmpA family protein [Acidobacteria bacterium]|nr:OmpA family protein [Acidobacteriota bacterium]